MLDAHASAPQLPDDPLIVLTGLPGTGKSSFLIRALRAHKEAGRQVSLLLSSESSHLTRRANVAPGKFMGCRVPKLGFPITDVVPTATARALLEAAPAGSVVAFDEAQYFQPELAQHWLEASRRGVFVIVGTPSRAQLALLTAAGVSPRNLDADCALCGHVKSDTVIYKTNLKEPTHVCSACARTFEADALAKLLADVEAGSPFPGEKHTYQPFHQIGMPGWKFVRGDSLARFSLLCDALQRYPGLAADVENPGKERTYADIGCCSGFFCDAMTGIGFTATGVDVGSDFIDWAGRMALHKRQSIRYVREDAERFLTSSSDQFDVMSSFATIQWVMAQRGYEAGVRCLHALFARTRHVCVLEMGYTREDIYKDKIADRPCEIGREWVLQQMRQHGGFAHVEMYPAGTGGIWRDVFIGFKTMPRAARDLTLKERMALRLRTSPWPARIKKRLAAVLKRG